MRTTGLPALLLLVFSPALYGTVAPAPPPTLTVGRLTAAIVLDGALTEPAWAGAGVIPDLTQQSPVPGRPTPYLTRIRVLVDRETLYIGVECMDPHPERIAVHTLQRDADLSADDNLAIVLDTFGDGRTGYLFRINTAGARQDGLISAASGATYDWDGVWDARTRRTAGGWTAEIAIPARTLRFRRGVDHWGFNVERYVARDRLTLRWAGATLDATLDDLTRAGRLAGIGELHQGLGLTAAPYGLLRYDHRSAPSLSRRSGDAGFDLGYNLTPGLGGLLTVHTDFAETEADAQQINLTRFPLFFPEKRAFFLEGSNLFDFASGLGTNFLPFYSRRLGLVGGAVVPLDEGLKLLATGRWSLAALDVQTGGSAAAPATNLFAGRATYDVDSHLRLGTLVTHGDPAGLGANTFSSFDAVWRTSTFRGDKNLLVSAWAARSDGTTPADRSPTGGASSHDGWGVRAEYPNDLFDTYAQLNQYGSSLDPALGFLPRPGTRQIAVGNAFQPRPSEEGPFGWARQFFFETYFTRVDDLAGRPESWRLFTAPLNVSLRSGEHVEMDYAPQFERLDQPFEVAKGVIIPPGPYRFDRYEVEAQSSAARPLRVGSNLWFGGFYSGTLVQWTCFVHATALGGQLRFELNGENDFGRLPQGHFIQRLWQLKVLYAFTPDLTVSTFTQYDSDAGGLGLNARLRWTLSPGRDLFMVWNRNWAQELAPGLHFTPAADQLTVKLCWMAAW